MFVFSSIDFLFIVQQIHDATSKLFYIATKRKCVAVSKK